jgi:hypothetical protein
MYPWIEHGGGGPGTPKRQGAVHGVKIGYND